MENDNRERSPEERFSQEQTGEILDRLMELDRAEARGLSRSELYDVAMELGISRELVDRAILDGRVAGSAGSVQVGLSSRSPLREALLFSAVGAGSFLPTALLGTSQLWGILGVGMISIALGLDSRRADAGLRFRTRNLGLWTGFVVGGSTLFAMAPDWALAMVIGFPVLAGTGVLLLGRWTGSHGSGESDTGRRGLRGAVARTLESILRVVQERRGRAAPQLQ